MGGREGDVGERGERRIGGDSGERSIKAGHKRNYIRNLMHRCTQR